MDKLTELFCLVDNFCQVFEPEWNKHCNGLIKQDTLIGSIYTATRGVYESNKVNEKAELQFRI